MHWGFSLGGIAKYAEYMDRVSEYAPVEMHNLCITRGDKHTDEEALRRLRARIIRVRSLFDLSWMSQLKPAIREVNPRAIMTHAFNGYAVGYVARKLMGTGLPMIASYHGAYYAPTLAKKLIAPIYNGFGDFVLRRHADAIVTVARHCANELRARGVDAKKITVVHNGIPDCVMTMEDRRRLRQEWGANAETIIVLAASQLVPYKGLDYLIEGYSRLLSRHPSVSLMILGMGPYESNLKQHVARLGLEKRITFGGMRNDIAACLSAADIFVLPSLLEAHSIALLEAMRAGKAIIATDVGGNTESVRDAREGLIVPPADSAALADALERLIESNALRESLGKNARARYLEEFTEQRMIEKTAKWLTEAVT